ncbi:hypothetical protein GALMADRAFT_219286 [Galerina marginata CBS 339.88]|uniref:DNA replication checkpoint mediator MRC1 domain-containing protein n=1 Tax=Galerina marginata (strain CBS 339.88) TaxID=685588 RepID=A0A067TUA5_GALM3|nr:hypothetical protein GALMADRAFT_219286 [Galerina marginata CBS 339.88]
MPLGIEYSLVADSTRASSPQPDLDASLQVKRATRTYGRRREEPQLEDPDSSISYSEHPPSSSHNSVHNTAPPGLLDEIPPSSPVVHPTDSDAGQQDTDEELPSQGSRYQFDWRKKLEEIDEDEAEISSAVKVDDAPNPPTFGEPLLLLGTTDPLLTLNAIDDRRDNLSLPSISDVFGTDSFSGRTESARIFSAQPSFSLSSPPPQSLNSRARTRRAKVIRDSDSEQEPAKNSSPATASSSSKLFVNTPNSGSSSTQPTSEDEMPPKPSAKPRSTGKQKAKKDSRSSVTPLIFTEGRTGEVKNNVTSKNKKKAKGLTEKEKKEMLKEKSRLILESAVSIPRAEVKVFSKEYFFTKVLESQGSVRAGQTSIPKASIPASDPIVAFSSPAKAIPAQPEERERPSHSMFRRKTPVLQDVPDNHDSDEDSDLPDIGEVLTKSINEDSKKKNLDQIKKRALEQQKRTVVLSDDDDDLEIVQANPKVAVKEEEHRRSAKKRPSEGRKRQLNLAKVNPTKQAARNASVLSPRRMQNDIAYALRNSEAGAIQPKDLNLILATAVQKRAQETSKKKEEEWKRHGGRVSAGTAIQPGGMASVVDAVVGQHLKATKMGDTADMDIDDEEDPSDEEWDPALRGSASPESAEGDDVEENDENSPDISMVDDSEAHEDEPRVRAPRRRLVTSDSEGENENDENAENVPMKSASQKLYRRATSSCDIATEEEDDKENNTKLMYDRSEDKENTAVVRHATLSLAPRSLFNGDDIATPPLSPVGVLGSWIAREPTVELGDESSAERRKPFKELISEESPLSTQIRPTNLTQSFAAKLQQASSSPSTLAPPPTLKAFISSAGSSSKSFSGGFSQFPDGDTDVFGAATKLQPGFSDLFESTTQKQKSPMGLNKEGDNLRKLKRTDTLELTQDVSIDLQPAFQDDGFLRKAEAILEKEDAFLQEGAAKEQLTKKPTIYVNDHGFLTQTRPADGSPEVYRPSPSQTLYSGIGRFATSLSLSLSPSQTQSRVRTPLRTLSISTPYSPEIEHRRLRKRDSTPPISDVQLGSPISGEPPPKQNAFDMLARAAQKEKRHKDLKQRSELAEFFQDEAAESDEEVAFGFVKSKVDRDEEDGEDMDKTLEELMDDKEMDDKTLAEELVQEKFREQLEVADQEDEKFHQDLIQGELRLKRRHGVGVDDSGDESDTEENEIARQARKKQRRSERGEIKDLEADEATRAFAEAYNQTLKDDDDEFAFLNKDSQLADILMTSTPVDDDADGQDEQDENDQETGPGTITHEEFIRLVREKKDTGMEDVEMDPRDVTWVDQDDEEEAPRVKTVNARQRHRGRAQDLDQSEMDVLGAAFRKPVNAMTDSSKQWFVQENKSRNAGTSRSVGGSAITGHAKAKSKTGNGTVRKSSLATKSAPTSNTASASGNKAVRPAQSALSVIADKSQHFG